MEKIGFFGGSFNPPTIAHIELANITIKEYKLDKLIFVPVGNQYKKIGLVDEKYRYEMLKIVCEELKHVEVSDIELKIKEELKAIDIFNILKEKYNHAELYYILGADNLEKMSSWKDAEELIKNFKFIILERGNLCLENILKKDKLLQKYAQNFKPIHNNMQISSTFIRQHIKEKEKIKPIITPKILDYIQKNKLYNID